MESAAGVSHNGQHAEAIEDDDDDEEDKTSEVAIRFIPHDKSICALFFFCLLFYFRFIYFS